VAVLQEQMEGLLADARGKVQAVNAEKIGKQVEDLVAQADGALADVRVTNKHLQELLARPGRDQELANVAVMVDELNRAVPRRSPDCHAAALRLYREFRRM
jgi:hypothetical protein